MLCGVTATNLVQNIIAIGNFVMFMQGKRQVVIVSFCPSNLGQNETDVKYSE